MLSNRLKAKVILGGFFGILTLGALLGWAPYAEAEFRPYVNGKRTMAADNALVVGGQVIQITASPANAEEAQNYVDWLEAQVWDLQGQLKSIQVPNCGADEKIRASGLSDKIANLSARIQAFIAR